MSKSNRHKKTPALAGAEVLVNESNFQERNVMANISTAASNVIPFKFGKHQVRTLLIDDQPWFCATDICTILGYMNASRTIGLHCRNRGVTKRYTPTSSGDQDLTFIDEGNLYRLIIKSKKEEAQEFESWACDEVLPAIRKHGHYEDTSNKMSTLVNELIGMTELNVIKGLIRDKAKAVPDDRRKGFALTMHSRLHTRFNVPRTELIPAGQFESACNFIAAYVHEGEWIGKEKPVKHLGGIFLSRDETQYLYALMSHFYMMNLHKDRLQVASVALDSEPLKKVYGQLHESIFSFKILDKRRADIYGEYCALGMTGGYAAWGEAA